MEKKEVLAHLFNNKDFKREFKRSNFSEADASALRRYAKGIDQEPPDCMHDFFEWLKYEFYDGGDVILEIAYDSDDFGPMGNGIIRYLEIFGLITRLSSDDVDDHIEIFNIDTFEPWGDDYINTGYVDIYSGDFDDEYLLAFAKEIVIQEKAVVTINGELIDRSSL